MTDDAKTVVNSYAYDPFGQVTRRSETTSNPFQFVGQYGAVADSNGLLSFRLRYYDSSIGRFLTKDLAFERITETQSLNRFIYASNNPIRLIDPSGLDWFDTTWDWAKSFSENVAEEIVLKALKRTLETQINRYGFDIFGEGLFEIHLRLPVIGNVIGLTLDVSEIVRAPNMDRTEKAARISLKIANAALLTIVDIYSRGSLSSIAAGTLSDASFEWQIRQIKRVAEPAGGFIYETFLAPETQLAPNPIGRPAKRNR
jgi:RHS repeat-associated protein